jgi:DNA-binding NarL/FixJ family response regulator
MKSTHILLIDDHAMVRSGLRMVLTAGIPNLVIFEADSLENIPEISMLDVILLDIKLPGASGIEGIAWIKQRWPHTAILMLTSLDTPETARLALARGATGFISKAETAEKIIAEITLVLQNDDTCGSVTEKCNLPAPKHLTQRQHEVLKLLGDGLSNKLIARDCSISENTVRRHVQDILEFFEVISRAEAVAVARRQAIID